MHSDQDDKSCQDFYDKFFICLSFETHVVIIQDFDLYLKISWLNNFFTLLLNFKYAEFITKHWKKMSPKVL